jgi:hypothetical protein
MPTSLQHQRQCKWSCIAETLKGEDNKVVEEEVVVEM